MLSFVITREYAAVLMQNKIWGSKEKNPSIINQI